MSLSHFFHSVVLNAYDRARFAAKSKAASVPASEQRQGFSNQNSVTLHPEIQVTTAISVSFFAPEILLSHHLVISIPLGQFRYKNSLNLSLYLLVFSCLNPLMLNLIILMPVHSAALEKWSSFAKSGGVNWSRDLFAYSRVLLTLFSATITAEFWGLFFNLQYICKILPIAFFFFFFN